MHVFTATMLATMGLIGCDKKTGEAVVLSKEHIDAKPPTAETPNMSPTGVQGTARPTETQAESAPTPDVQIREMADDEIDVEGYVMKPEVRGTSRDPRAKENEQWLVKVRILDVGRTIQFPADKVQWGKLRENDRIRVKYRTGKYTGSIWTAEIE